MPVNNIAPILVMKKGIVSNGTYPFRGDEGSGAHDGGLATVRLFGYNFAPGGHIDTAGALVPIQQNTALFSLLGTFYGGNGQTNFAVPDFSTRIAGGAGTGPGLTTDFLGQVEGVDAVDLERAELPIARGGNGFSVENEQQTLSINYVINANGLFPSRSLTADTIGVVSEFAGNFAPNGTIPCDGRLLSISEYSALFAVIGTIYGGDGISTFAVPDLRGRTPVGVGQGPGLNNVNLGQVFGSEEVTLATANLPVAMGGSGAAVSNYGPSLGINFVVSLEGIYPSRDSGGGGLGEPYIGEIFMFAGNIIPDRNVVAAGQQLSIAQNQALFSLYGTQFGGNGQTTFALPDLRGRSPVNSGEHEVGTQLGTQTYTVGIEEFGALFLNGTGGPDAYYGANQNDTINGFAGNDTLVGNAGNDTIDGGTGADAMSGGAGNDVFTVDNAGDTVVGGADFDRINTALAAYSLGADVEELVFTGTGDFAGSGGAGANTITGGAGNDVLKGRDGNDTLNGGLGNDTLHGGLGADTMNGGDGDDTFLVDNAGDVANGGAGTDTVLVTAAITLVAAAGVERFETLGGVNATLTLNALDNVYGGSTGIDIVNGGDGNDTMVTRAGNDVLSGGNGNDRIEAQEGNDTLNGDAGNDVLEGGIGDDVLNGGANDDTLFGGDGQDILIGGGGGDFLDGGAGADTLNGGDGNDTLKVDLSSDIAIGGAGVDTVQLAGPGGVYVLADDIEIATNTTFSVVQATLNALDNIYAGGVGPDIVFAGDGNDTVITGGGNDTVVGGGGNDRIDTGIGADSLEGGDGNDVLEGGADYDRLFGDGGDDTLFAGDGDDFLVGGVGADLLFGGAGRDLFAFDDGDAAAVDRIADFDAAQGDRIDLTAIDAIAGVADSIFTFIGGSAFSGTAGELRVETIGGFAVVMGDSDGDGIADLIIRVDGAPALTDAEIYL